MARKTTKSRAQKTKGTPVIKHQKPIFRTGTWITLFVLAVLIGFTYYLNSKKDSTETVATPASKESFVFSELDGNITSIEIKAADGETVKVARNNENAWALELPLAAEADQGLVEAAASQIMALNIVSTVDADPGILGLDEPAYVITIGFTDGKEHTLEIGGNTPTNSGYYVRVDGKNIMILTLSGIDSLTTLVQSPPLPSTSTPEVTVTPTP